VPRPNDIRGGFENLCIDPALQKSVADQALKNYTHSEDTWLEMAWVDYILTTANSWKTPIKDFTLIIDKRKNSGHIVAPERRYVSMCWDGPVRQMDAAHLFLHKTNFVPKKEIRVAFFCFGMPPDK
jgi:hypothetical protein